MSEVLHMLQTSAAGLQDAESKRLLALHGPNTLTKTSGPSMLRLLLRQFESLIVWILVVAAAVMAWHGWVISPTARSSSPSS